MSVFTGEGISSLDVKVAGGAAVNMPFCNMFKVNAAIETLTFKGDHDTFLKYIVSTISGEMHFDKLSTDMFTALGMTEVTSSLPAGYASRFYPQLATAPYVELNAYEFVTDDSTGTDTLHAIRVFKAKPQLYVPAEAGNIAVMTTSYSWSATKTLTDIDAVALPGVSTTKVSYALDIAA
jgi:hypothetical protein